MALCSEISTIALTVLGLMLGPLASRPNAIWLAATYLDPISTTPNTFLKLYSSKLIAHIFCMAICIGRTA